MTYIFRLVVEKEKSRLMLLGDGIEMAAREWPESRDTGRRLFEALAEILKEQGLKPEAVEDFQVESIVPEIYTSMRIAETVKRVYAFGVARLR